jgi:hypothetical protein
MLACRKKGSCGSVISLDRTSCRGIVERSIPSTMMEPDCSSMSRKRDATSVLLPLLKVRYLGSIPLRDVARMLTFPFCRKLQLFGKEGCPTKCF